MINKELGIMKYNSIDLLMNTDELQWNDKEGKSYIMNSNLRKHMKSCLGEECVGDKVKCGKCAKWMKKTSLTKHRKRCGVSVDARPVTQARKYVGKTKPCPSCGRELAATNMSRHLKICQS